MTKNQLQNKIHDFVWREYIDLVVSIPKKDWWYQKNKKNIDCVKKVVKWWYKNLQARRSTNSHQLLIADRSNKRLRNIQFYRPFRFGMHLKFAILLIIANVSFSLFYPYLFRQLSAKERDARSFVFMLLTQ